MKSYLTFIMSVFLLTACGGGDNSAIPLNPDNNGNHSNVPVNVYAQDVITSTKINHPRTIDLKDKVHLSHQNEDFAVIGLKNIGKETCQVSLSEDKKSIQVSHDQVGDCLYQYTVETKTTHNTRSSAHLRVGVGTTYADATLPTITESFNLTHATSLTVNLKTELMASGVDLTGYKLDPVLVVVGEGSASVVDADQATITYTATVAEPYATVYYSLYKLLDDDGFDIKLGALVVAVSDSDTDNGVPFKARNFTFNYFDSQGDYQMVGVNELVAINVRPYLDAPSLDILDDAQLVLAVSANAQAFSIYNKNANPDGSLYGQYLQNGETELTNKTLLFQASSPGTYDIIYTVTDHEGFYDNGVIRLTVYNKEDMFSLQGWGSVTEVICDMSSAAFNSQKYGNNVFGDIRDSLGEYANVPITNMDTNDYCQPFYESQGQTYNAQEKLVLTKFTPPISKTLAEYYNIDFTDSYYHDDVKDEVVQFTREQAVNYCASINGRLPTVSELSQLVLLQYKNAPAGGYQDIRDKGWPAATSNSSTTLDPTVTYWTMDRSEPTKVYGKTLTTAQAYSDNTGERHPQITVDPNQGINPTALTSCVLFNDNQGTQYASVKPYTITTTITPDPKVGVKYQLESTVIDPHGDLSIYQDVTYELLENVGHFIENGNQVLSETNLTGASGALEGKVVNYYYDDSFNRAVILIHLTGYQVDSKLIDPANNLLEQMNWAGWRQVGNVDARPGGECNSDNEVRSDYCWKRLSYVDHQGDNDRGPIDIHGVSYGLHQASRVIEEGLPLWIKPNYQYQGNSNSNTNASNNQDYLGFGKTAIRNVNQYTRPYTGENFMVRIKVSNLSEYTPTAGRIVFSLHQPNEPKDGIHNGNSLYRDAQLAGHSQEQEGGNLNGYYYGTDLSDPGIMCEGVDGTPGKGRQFAFVYDYLEQSFVIRNQCGNNVVAKRSLKGFRQQYAYMWIKYTNGENDPTVANPKSVNGRLQVYVSPTEIRPEDPFIDIDSSIDTAQVGWATSNVVVGATDTPITDIVTNEVYSDYPYYILVAVRVDYDPHATRANTASMDELRLSTWDHEEVVD